MWLEFFKECIMTLIFLGINLLSLSTSFFQIPAKVLICFPTVQFHSFHNRNSWQIFCVHLNAILKTKVDCFTVTKVSFINDVHFIFCSYSIFRCTKQFTQSHFGVESGSYFVRSEQRYIFSLVLSTYGKYILILISFSWISVVCVCCCDWGKWYHNLVIFEGKRSMPFDVTSLYRNIPIIDKLNIIKNCVKVGLSPSQKSLLYLLQWKSFKNDEKCSCFILKALFVLRIFKFLPWSFCHLEKMAWLER